MLSYENNGELCEKILNENKTVQSAAIINRRGKVEACSQRDSVEPLSLHTNELFLMHCVLQISIGKDFDEHYGPVNYHISERPNLVILSFPIGDKVVLVMVNKDESLIILARKIVNDINELKDSSPPSYITPL